MKKGFTLAEVLITLGVIGIVAALTLPNVLQNYRERTYIASLQKAYNTVSNAVVALMAAEQIDDLGQSSLVYADGRNAFMYKYMKIVKDCENGSGECLNNNYEPVERGESMSVEELRIPGNTDYKCGVLDSGCGVCFSTFDKNANAAYVMLDTNATKGPNINGRDFWQFIVNADGRVGAGANLSSYAPLSYCEGYSYTCAGKVIADGWQMKY